MRGLVAGLLLGLALGYGLAFLRKPQPGPARAARGDAARSERTAANDVPSAADKPKPQPVRRKRGPDPEPDDGPDSVDLLGPIPPRLLGTLLIRADGTEIRAIEAKVEADLPWDRLESTTMFPDFEYLAEPSEADETLARYMLWPGQYRIAWASGNQVRRTAYVAIRAKETTTLALNEPDVTVARPVPPDRARLTVLAYGLDGRRGLDCGFELVAAHLGAFTSDYFPLEGGRKSILMRPTRVQVRVAGRKRHALLRAGRETRLEFRYDGEGELRFEGEPEGWPELRLPGDPETSYGVEIREEGAGCAGIAYVPPGDYELWSGSSKRARCLGRVRVEAGRTTTFRQRRPAGGLRLLLRGGAHECEGTAVLARAIEQPDEPGSFRHDVHLEGEKPDVVTFDHVPPGLWRLRVTAPDYLTHESEITIGEDVIEQKITLRPQ